MNYGNFNARVRSRVVENDADIVTLATYKAPQDNILQSIYMYFFIKGVSSVTNEIVTMRLHTSDNLGRVFASSTPIRMSTMFEGTTNFKGRVRFDFPNVPINTNTTYTITIATTNYTRNGNTFYFTVDKDFPFTTNSNGSAETADSPDDYAVKFEFFGEI